MKKFVLLMAALSGLTAFSELADQNSGLNLNVTSNSSAWEVEMRGNSSILAFQPDTNVEIIIDISNLLPNSPLCMSNKRIKDIKMTLDIHKKATQNETNWVKSFEKTRIRFISGRDNVERKIYGSLLIKNNLRFNAGEVVNVGTLQFLSPLVCQDILNSSMRIYGMEVGGRRLPVLDFTLKSEK